MFWIKKEELFELVDADFVCQIRTDKEPENARVFTEDSLAQYLNQKQVNATALAFLQNSDWKVLRHIRQKNLQAVKSITDEEYLALEQQRQAAAASIIDVDSAASGLDIIVEGIESK